MDRGIPIIKSLNNAGSYLMDMTKRGPIQEDRTTTFIIEGHKIELTIRHYLRGSQRGQRDIERVKIDEQDYRQDFSDAMDD
jgi:hypothetical protein